MTEKIKIKATEINDQELEYETEKVLSIENIVSEALLFGQQDLTQVLNFIKNNASLNNYVAIANSIVETNSTAYVDVPDLIITPNVAGTYIVITALKTAHTQANNYGYYILSKNNIDIANTETTLYFASKDLTLTALAASQVVFNGTTDNIKMKWKSGGGKLDGLTRFILMFRVA